MPSRLRLALVPFLALALLLCVVAPRPAPADEGGAAPASVTVVRRAFVVTLDATGSFAPDGAREVACEPEEYGGALEIVEAAGPGPVVAGQTLVAFDGKDLAEQIQDRERDLFIARTRLQEQEENLRTKKALLDIQRQQVAARLERALADHERWKSYDRPLRIRQAEFNLQAQEDRLQDEREEFEQLVRMYEADDLTEETEAIVIRRARRGLQRMEQSLVWARERHQELLEITLPREDLDKELELAKRRQEHDNFMATMEADLRRAELEMEKARDAFAEQETKFRELREDRERLRVRAPIDGYAVPGQYAGGWKDIDGARRALAVGERVKAGQVLFTVVKPGDVDVETEVAEADLPRVKVGQLVEVRPGIAPETVLTGQVSEVLPVAKGGKYAVRVALKETQERLMPGQSCKLKIQVRRQEAALVLPRKAVHVENGKARVWVVVEGKDPAERAIRIGDESDGRVEVLEGLAEGDSVLAKPPVEDK